MNAQAIADLFAEMLDEEGERRGLRQSERATCQLDLARDAVRTVSAALDEVNRPGGLLGKEHIARRIN